VRLIAFGCRPNARSKASFKILFTDGLAFLERVMMLRRAISFLRDNRGIAALEYALIAGLMFAAIIGATALLKTKLSSAFNNLGTSLTIRDAGT
jgi:pilus assembly protein Flp/PilA